MEAPYEEEPPSERPIVAVVLAADGRPEGVDEGFQLAAPDWRDLLVDAALQHEDWREALDSRVGPAVT